MGILNFHIWKYCNLEFVSENQKSWLWSVIWATRSVDIYSTKQREVPSDAIHKLHQTVFCRAMETFMKE